MIKNSAKSSNNKDDFMAQTSESPFAMILNKIGEEVMVINDKGYIVYLNKIALKNFALPEDKIIGKPITSFFKSKISLTKWKQLFFDRIKQKRTPQQFIIERVIKDNLIQTVDITAVYMTYNNKGYTVSIARNITDRIALERELNESEERYRLLSEQAGEGIFTIDLKGNILYANSTAKHLVKIPKGVMKRNFLNFIEQGSKRKALRLFNYLKKGQRIILEDINVVDGFGNVFPMEFTASPNYRNGKIFQFVVIFRDISKKKELEQFLRDTEKRKIWNLFVSGTAQEILGPLKGLHQTAQNLIHRYQNRDFEYVGYNEYRDIIKTLQTMSDQIKYCHDTTSTLIHINKKRAGLKKNFCDLNEVISDIVKNLEHQLRVNNTKFKKKIPATLPLVAIDPTDFGQILNCVLTNALQSIPHHGEIDLSAKVDHQRNKVVLTCKDNGVGISKENLHRVFDPFFTTKERGLEKSSGLGLAIVHSLIRAARGDIQISSSLKKGTTVKIILPIFIKTKKKNSSKSTK